jgi:hypothetical protein
MFWALSARDPSPLEAVLQLMARGPAVTCEGLDWPIAEIAETIIKGIVKRIFFI